MGISFNVSAEEGLIPDWIKSTAGFWVDGQIGDAEFLSALQYLVKEELLVIPDETSSEIVTISEQELTTSKSKTTEDTLDYGTSYKFTYNIGDKVENKQNVDFTYEFYNGDTWIKGAGLRILCYMSDGDFREGGMGLFLPLLPYENYKNSKTRIYDVNTAVIEKCEIIDETKVIVYITIEMLRGGVVTSLTLVNYYDEIKTKITQNKQPITQTHTHTHKYISTNYYLHSLTHTA